MRSEAELEAVRAAARASIVAYAMLYDPKYKPNRFHRLIASRIERAVERGHGRIIIQAPPQHGKSRMVSQDMPAWFMGKFPEAPIIAAAYGTDLTERNGQEVRDRLSSPMHIDVFGEYAMLRADTTAKTNFMTRSGGRYLGPTVRGGATGFGARLFVIDDPFKDRAEADSETVRKQVVNWYQSAVYTRLEENSILVVMHTRWHEDDLAGWLQAEHPDEDWEVISLPAVAEENDLLGREVGEPLLPDVRSAEWLLGAKKALGTRDWNSLYQQTPVKRHARSEFEQTWFKRHNGISQDDADEWNKYIIVDPTRTKNAGSDNAAMAVIGLAPDGNRYVLEIVRDKMDLPDRYRELTRLVKNWEPHHVYYKKTTAENEIEAIELFQQRDNYRYTVTPLAERGDKNTRIRRMVPDLEAGRWYFPRNAWRKMWDGDHRDQMADFMLEEVAPFPFADYDDMLDCLSGAYDVTEQWPHGTNKTRARGSFLPRSYSQMVPG